jgi:hypothetical protein
MAAMWPDTDELAQVLNIAPSDAVDDWQTTLDRVMAAGIAKVKSDVGLWGDTDEDTPSDSLAQAALRMAELMATRPTDPSVARDPTYLRLLTGYRRRWGTA